MTYDGLHGYQYLERQGTPARYPFGYGLAYTQFEYTAVSVHASPPELSVEVEVRNTGTRRGTETVQVYLSGIQPDGGRSPRRLWVYDQVDLDPGEDSVVLMFPPEEELDRYDVDTGTWHRDVTEFEAAAGPNSGAALLTDRFSY